MPQLPYIEAPSLDEIKTAIVGRSGGKRQRFFRKARETAVKAYIRALPDDLDRSYFLHLIKAALAEFLATFLFVFIGVGIVISSAVQTIDESTQEYTLDSGRMLVIAFGYGIAYVLAVAIATPVSGGHVNPVVTLAYVATGRLDALAGIVYAIIQLAASTFSIGLLAFIWSSTSLISIASSSLSSSLSSFKAFSIELSLTFVLVFVIWGCAVDMNGNRTLSPYFIGLAVFVTTLFGIPLTGPSMNPALTFGIQVWTADFSYAWVYWFGPGLGSLVASFLYDFVFIRTAKPEESFDFYEEIVDEHASEA